MTANEIVKMAISQIGVKENPSGSNKVKYNTWYYGKTVSGSDYPWCCVFVNWVFNECGAADLFCGGKKTAYCPTVENYYKSINRFYSEGKKGDLVLFDFGKGRASHIGIVESKNADGTYTTIEGNTSTSSDDNGGCVMRRVRKKSVIRGFARPDYSNATTVETEKGGSTVNIVLSVLRKGSKGEEVKTLQRLLNSMGYSCGPAGVDGDFGNGTLSAVKKYQSANKLTADGIVGQNTWNSILK